MKSTLAIACALFSLPGLANSDGIMPNASDPHLAGGATTVFDTSMSAFSQPANNASPAQQNNFFIGNAFFKQPWVVAPSPTPARDGLGPLFNINSCQNCHIQAGKGHPPLTDNDLFLSTLVRLSIPAKTDAQRAMLKTVGVVPEPTYGDQLQIHGIDGVKGEATPRFTYTEIKGTFKDGENYTLLQPKLLIEGLNYGKLHENVQTSARIAPVLIGLGLLETLTETDILAHADPEDKDGDGISGRANYVWDVALQKTMLGRFGWKANQPSVVQQTATAFNNDIGITSTLRPQASCTAKQSECNKQPDGGKPEAPPNLVEAVAFYASLLAVPARRDVDDASVLQGQKLFRQAGCAACHTPAFTTSRKEGFPALEHQPIQPFTDLLLHDMGEGLADKRPDFEANGNEWRTAPLWGIGLVETVNGHTRFLHDGRARNLMEAILWHGGEAVKARQAVLSMSKEERNALLRFLNSL
jgi:CxxC motif-containing protein (DUF1111 family)